MMPGLFSNHANDVSMFSELFSSPNFQPDMLKIYPCMVMKGTGLYRMWKKGKYVPYTTDEAAEVIADMTRYIPPYVRVMRIQRDIPSNLVSAGVKNSNLRQIVDRILDSRGEKCNCIRCREIKGENFDSKNAVLSRINYHASEGNEIFLSFEDKTQGKLIGFLHLRIPSEHVFRKELRRKAAIVRELHVYGSEVLVGEKKEAAQHAGFGKRLLHEAERIAKKEFGMKKLAVISGVGAREYYRKFGYKNDGPYVSKRLG